MLKNRFCFENSLKIFKSVIVENLLKMLKIFRAVYYVENSSV